jgi:molecular chaperone GrpE
MSMQDAEGVESGNVIAVFQKGYTLNGRLVRPAMVIVAK